MQSFDLWWKYIALALTAAFAILGLFTDVKDNKTRKITGWGIFAVFGFVASAVGGCVAVFLEQQHSDAAAQLERDHQTKVLTNLELSVNSMERILTPLGKPNLALVMDLDCKQAALSAFCASAFSQFSSITDPNLIKNGPDFAQNKDMPLYTQDGNKSDQAIIRTSSAVWTKWPDQPGPPQFLVTALGFVDRTKIESALKGERQVADLTLTYKSSYDETHTVAVVDGKNKTIRMMISFGSPVYFGEGGQIYSTKDIPKANFILYDSNNSIVNFNIWNITLFGIRNEPATIEVSKLRKNQYTTPDNITVSAYIYDPSK